MNIVNGGAHANNSLDFQEFMIVPLGLPSFREALRAGAEVFHNLKKILSKRGSSTAVGDEGGFAPDLAGADAACEVVVEAIKAAGYTPGKDICLALDVASSELFDKTSLKYVFKKEKKELDVAGMVALYRGLVDKFHVVSVEDGMAENDWDGWKKLTDDLGGRVQLVGDDVFVTNPERIKEGIRRGSANSLLVKVNQIGSVTETLEAVETAHRAFKSGDVLAAADLNDSFAAVDERLTRAEARDPFAGTYPAVLGLGIGAWACGVAPASLNLSSSAPPNTQLVSSAFGNVLFT